jgi:hypothetical protein
LLLLCSCGKDSGDRVGEDTGGGHLEVAKKELMGKWVGSEAGEHLSIEFRDQNVVLIEDGEEMIRGTYDILENDRFLLTIEDEMQIMNYSLEGGDLTITSPEHERIVLRRPRP